MSLSASLIGLPSPEKPDTSSCCPPRSLGAAGSFARHPRLPPPRRLVDGCCLETGAAFAGERPLDGSSAALPFHSALWKVSPLWTGRGDWLEGEPTCIIHERLIGGQPLAGLGSSLAPEAGEAWPQHEPCRAGAAAGGGGRCRHGGGGGSALGGLRGVREGAGRFLPQVHPGAGRGGAVPRRPLLEGRPAWSLPAVPSVPSVSAAAAPAGAFAGGEPLLAGHGQGLGSGRFSVWLPSLRAAGGSCCLM